MTTEKGITHYFGTNLAKLLSSKITAIYKDFNSKKYISIKKSCSDKDAEKDEESEKESKEKGEENYLVNIESYYEELNFILLI